MESLDGINDFCKSNKIEIIIPADMVALNDLCVMRAKLSSPLLLLDNKSKIDLLNDKDAFYEWMKMHKISTPYTQLITKISDLDANRTFPLVVKPTNEGGGNGVKIINNADELSKHITSGMPFTKPPLLVQDFIVGKDIDVSILAKNGRSIAYTIQKWHDKGILEFIANEEALGIAKNIVELLNYSGLAHFDMRIDAKTNKVYVLECNPRIWGSIAASFMMGVDFMKLGIEATLTEKKTILPEYKKGYYVLIGSIGRALRKMNLQYFSKTTFKNICDVLSDPLPYLISEFQILLKLF